jgi:hypothetical protein
VPDSRTAFSGNGYSDCPLSSFATGPQAIELGVNFIDAARAIGRGGPRAKIIPPGEAMVTAKAD